MEDPVSKKIQPDLLERYPARGHHSKEKLSSFTVKSSSRTPISIFSVLQGFLNLLGVVDDDDDDDDEDEDDERCKSSHSQKGKKDISNE